MKDTITGHDYQPDAIDVSPDANAKMRQAALNAPLPVDFVHAVKNADMLAQQNQKLRALCGQLVGALESILACQQFSDDGQYKGWRIAAGSEHGGGLTQRAETARHVLAAAKEAGI